MKNLSLSIKYFLKKHGNFIRGASSVFFIYTPYRPHNLSSKLVKHTDEEALSQDWERIGQDLINAAKKIGSLK